MTIIAIVRTGYPRFPRKNKKRFKSLLRAHLKVRARVIIRLEGAA